MGDRIEHDADLRHLAHHEPDRNLCVCVCVCVCAWGCSHARVSLRVRACVCVCKCGALSSKARRKGARVAAMGEGCGVPLGRGLVRTQQYGKRCTKLVVPSMGSTIQVGASCVQECNSATICKLHACCKPRTLHVVHATCSCCMLWMLHVVMQRGAQPAQCCRLHGVRCELHVGTPSGATPQTSRSLPHPPRLPCACVCARARARVILCACVIVCVSV